jgi:hypothetical protein
MNLARLITPLVLAALATGGCAGGPDAADLVSHEAGARVSEADAAAALLDYVGVVNAALGSGETDDLAAMTAPSCPCRDLVGLIDAGFADGGALVGAAFDVGDVTVLGVRARRARVRARVSVSRYDVRNRDGLMLATRPAQEFVATYTLRLRADAWRVVDVHQGG